MAERSLKEKLDQAIDAMLEYGGFAPVAGTEAELATFVRVSAELRGMPSENFKATLKADLIRRGTMAATTANAASRAAAGPQSQTVIPRLCFRDSRRAIEFYERIFGAKEISRLIDPDQKIGHAEIQIGNTRIMLSDEYPEFGSISPETLGGSTVRIKLMVPDVDATAQNALAAGAKMVRPVQDQFYGERAGQFADPFGYTWIIATHKEDVSVEEMQRRLNEILNQPSEGLEEKMESNPAVSKAKSGATGAVKAVPYIREGFHAVTPYILVGGAAKFIDFLVEAFGAEERGRVPTPGGKIMHAEVKLGDSMIEMSDGNEQYGPSPVTIHLTVPDPDAAYQRALRAGAMSLFEPREQFWGEHEGGVRDPFGNEWYIAPPSPQYPHPTVQPYLHLHDAEKMIPFLEAAFGAKAEGVHKWPGGAIAHATVRIGDSELEIDEAFRANRQTQCHLHLYVPDTDAVYAQALRAGATSIETPNDKPYGDRSAGVKDAWGNSWFIATHIKDVAF